MYTIFRLQVFIHRRSPEREDKETKDMETVTVRQQ